jgi:hypothetical protein
MLITTSITAQTSYVERRSHNEPEPCPFCHFIGDKIMDFPSEGLTTKPLYCCCELSDDTAPERSASTHGPL